MHRCQYNKTWSNQDKSPAGNLNWHNVKTMLPSHYNIEYSSLHYFAFFITKYYPKQYTVLISAYPASKRHTERFCWQLSLKTSRNQGTALVENFLPSDFPGLSTFPVF